MMIFIVKCIIDHFNLIAIKSIKFAQSKYMLFIKDDNKKLDALCHINWCFMRVLHSDFWSYYLYILVSKD